MTLRKRLLAAATALALAASLTLIVLIAVKIRVAVGGLPATETVRFDWRLPVLYKCCKFGQQLDASLSCVPRPGSVVSEKKSDKEIHPNNTQKRYWVPQHFYNRSINVMYGTVIFGFHDRQGMPTVIYEEDFDKYFYDNWGGLWKTDYALGYHLYNRHQTCADALDGRGVVLLSYPCAWFLDCLRKCCRIHQHLRRTTKGIECAGNDTDVLSIPDFINERTDVIDTTYERCKPGVFKMADGDTYTVDRVKEVAKSYSIPAKRFYDYETCADTVQREGGGRDLVLGSCGRYIGAWRVLWHVSQPSCWVAGALLVLSLTGVALQPSLRSTNHGRSLACHAAALLLLNFAYVYFRYLSGIPKLWPLGADTFHLWVAIVKHSRIVAYVVYFCLHSANCWLTCLCFNMANGLRRMQLAPAVARRGSEKRRPEWGVFAMYSAFGWGAPLILTSLTAYLWENAKISPDRRLEKTSTFVLPSLVETRTFFYDREHAFFTKTFDNGSFYYYFLPAGIVFGINLVLFFYIGFLIRRAKQETSLVRQVDAGRINVIRDSAWLYIRLLLSTGVLEAAVEITTWLSTQNVSHSVYSSWQQFRYLLCQYEGPLNIIDVIRAGLIFSLTCVNPYMRQWIRTTSKEFAESKRRLWRRGKEVGRAPATALASTIANTVRRMVGRPNLQEERVELGPLKAEPENEKATADSIMASSPIKASAPTTATSNDAGPRASVDSTDSTVNTVTPTATNSVAPTATNSVTPTAVKTITPVPVATDSPAGLVEPSTPTAPSFTLTTSTALPPTPPLTPSFPHPPLVHPHFRPQFRLHAKSSAF